MPEGARARWNLLAVVGALVFCSGATAQTWEWTGNANDNWNWCGNGGPGNWSIAPGVPGVSRDCNGDGVPEDYTGVNVLIEPGSATVNAIALIGEFRLGSLNVQGGGMPRLKLDDLLTLDGASSFQDVEVWQTLTVNNNLSWFGDHSGWRRGAIKGNGAVAVTGGTLSVGAQNHTRVLDGITLSNFSNVEQFLALHLLNGATVDNHGTWTLGNGTHATSVIEDTGGGVFRNFGTLTTNPAFMQVVLVNAPLNMEGGVVEVNSETLELRGSGVHANGSYNVAMGAFLWLGGAGDPVHIAGNMSADGAGTLRIHYPMVIEPKGTLDLNLSGENPAGIGGWLDGVSTGVVLEVNGTLNNNADLRWSSMIIEGTGEVNNGNGATLHIVDGSVHTLAALLCNDGIVVQESDVNLDSGTIENSFMAKWILVDGDISGTGTINNAGTIEKPIASGVGTSSINATVLFDQGRLHSCGGKTVLTGHVVVNGNSLMSTGSSAINEIEFDGGTLTMNNAATLRLVGAGYVELSETEVFLNGSPRLDNEETTVIMSDVLISGCGVVCNDAGTMIVSRTSIQQCAVLENHDQLFIGNVDVHATLSNIPTDAIIVQDAACAVHAEGLIDNGGRYHVFADLGIAAGGEFINRNSFLKPIGSPPLVTVSGYFDNQGTVILESDTLHMTGPLPQLDGGVLNGGEWIVLPGAQLNLGNCDVIHTIGAGAAVTGDLAGFSSCMSIDTNDGVCNWNGDFSAPGSCNNTGDWNVVEGTCTINGDFNCGDADGATTTVTPSGSLHATGDINNGTPGGGVLSEINSSYTQTLEGGAAGGYTCQNLNNYSNILPGGRNAVGPFNLTGNFNQFDIGALQIELAGLTPITEHDQLIVEGDVSLDGTLHVSVLPGYEPTGGEQSTIITATGGTISGDFDQITGGGEWSVQVNANDVVLTLITPPCDGDLTADGTVNVLDLLAMLGAWGGCPFGCASDLNFDGVVNVLDLLVLLGHWGGC